MKNIYKLLILSFLVFIPFFSFPQINNNVILYTPFGTNNFWSVDADNEGTIWCGSSNGLGLFKFKNDTWSRYDVSNDILDLSVDQNNNIFFGEHQNLVEFNGTLFNYFQSSLNMGGFGINTWVQNLIVNNNGDIWVGGDWTQIAKYDGTNWTTWDSLHTNIVDMAFKRVRSFAKDSKENIYFANMSEPQPNTTSDDYVLIKYDGQNFNVLTTQPAEVPNWYLHVITVDSNDHIWYGNKFNYLIEYDGQNFQYFTPPQNMPLGGIWAVTVDKYDQKWLAADSGIYKYYNNQWTEYKYRDLGLIRGFPGSYAFDLAVDKNNNLWLATNWGMVQFNPNGIVTDVNDELVNLPNDFKLSQNYPNPFNPGTVISYQLPASGFVTLKVFDVLGKYVATLVNEEKPAGNYTVNFNAGNLTSGIYFYRLQSGSFIQTKKLVLMK